MSLEVVQTPFGKFQIDPQDLIGMTLKAGTLWDGPGFLQPLAIEYGRLGERGTTILDVGANIGAFSVWLASQGAWRVIAVEALPQTMLQLKANLDLNKAVTAERVIPLETAAYDQLTRLRVAQFDFHNLGGTAFGPLRDSLSDITVMASPLDEYSWAFGDRVSLIKIDVQGCDARAIFGLEQTIERHHPAIIFEWEADLAVAHGVELGQLTEWLTKRDYQVHPWPSQPNNFLAVAKSWMRTPCL